MAALNSNTQLRYLIQWFREFSELQKSDFLPILAENYANKVYINGIVGGLTNINCQDKPMSLFECRLKLFKEWFPQWNIETKEFFLKQIAEIDANFMEKLNQEIEIETNNENSIQNGDNLLPNNNEEENNA